MNNAPIGIFDSGVGGLNILSACMRVAPNEQYIYVFDKSCSPYGNKRNDFIISRVGYLTETLKDMGCKMVIFACNTATNVAIDKLRRYYSIPLVGVEPPILPAVKNSNGGKILVLLTESTAKQAKFLNLVKNCGYGNLIVAPQKDLAYLIEQNFGLLENIRNYVYTVLDRYGEVESVVLGCTHYYHIKNMIAQYYGSDVTIYDASQAVARRVIDVLKENNLLADRTCSPKPKIYYF